MMASFAGRSELLPAAFKTMTLRQGQATDVRDVKKAACEPLEAPRATVSTLRSPF